MEKQFVIGLIGCLALTHPPAAVQAQEPDLQPYGAKAWPNRDAASYKSHIGVYVRAKVMRTFLQVFDGATDVQWHISTYRYLVLFKKGGRACRALFALNGALLYALQYGTEQQLPQDVQKRIKSRYPKFGIGPVAEMDSNNTKAWIVNLEDADNLVVLRIVNSELEELRHYKTHF